MKLSKQCHTEIQAARQHDLLGPKNSNQVSAGLATVSLVPLLTLPNYKQDNPSRQHRESRGATYLNGKSASGPDVNHLHSRDIQPGNYQPPEPCVLGILCPSRGQDTSLIFAPGISFVRIVKRIAHSPVFVCVCAAVRYLLMILTCRDSWSRGGVDHSIDLVSCNKSWQPDRQLFPPSLSGSIIRSCTENGRAPKKK